MNSCHCDNSGTDPEKPACLTDGPDIDNPRRPMNEESEDQKDDDNTDETEENLGEGPERQPEEPASSKGDGDKGWAQLCTQTTKVQRSWTAQTEKFRATLRETLAIAQAEMKLSHSKKDHPHIRVPWAICARRTRTGQAVLNDDTEKLEAIIQRSQAKEQDPDSDEEKDAAKPAQANDLPKDGKDADDAGQVKNDLEGAKGKEVEEGDASEDAGSKKGEKDGHSDLVGTVLGGAGG